MYMQKSTITYLAAGLFLVAGALFLSSCNESTAGKPDEGKQAYIIPDSLMKTLAVDTVRQGELINSLTITGMVDFNQDKQVNIFPLVSGNIREIKVQLGDFVQAGQVLATVRSSEMAGYTNNLIVAQTNVNATRKQLAATTDLFQSGLASNLDVTNAQVNYDQAIAQLEMVKRILKINGDDTSGRYVVKTPIPGFLVQKQVTNDQTIRPDNGNALFTISDLKDVWVWGNVYEANLDKIHLGDKVDVTTLSYPGRVFEGRVDKIMHVLDPTSKVMKVRVVIGNSDFALRPQMYATITATNTEHKQAIYVPLGALVFDNSRYFVVVYHGNGKADITPVDRMSILGTKVYLTDGVKPGDLVIASNTLAIYDQLNN